MGYQDRGEGVGLLERKRGWDAPCLSRSRRVGVRLTPLAPRSIPMKRISAPEQTREHLRALIEDCLGTAPDRSSLVLLAARLILEEALEGEVRDEIGRERYERADGEAKGYRNGYRPGQMKTAEGMVEFSERQVRDTREPFVSAVSGDLAGRTLAVEDLAVDVYARGL